MQIAASSQPRYVCIHGHFYQPPRENPGLEAIEIQDTAYPYHDWNERISDECYATNACSRILDSQRNIQRIVNNYARISFNMGPTLLSWLERHRPETYARILEADRESIERFGGHGNAIAQAYNHTILPLATRRDKETQARWSIADFVHRFSRMPEGMWLPEAAVDTESLEVLAEAGILFTLLSPYQAHECRPLEGAPTETAAWQDVRGGRIDPSRPYRMKLPSGRSITLFFYDGPISQAVAFERLLNRGEDLAHRLLSGFQASRSGPQLSHISTDGESYGHHHRHGDMALAYALDVIEARDDLKLTNYGQMLALHPPTWEVRVIERSAWSCAHGVGRWSRDCGCSGGRIRGHHRWRAPLRAALDWLRVTLDEHYQSAASHLLLEPWQARDAYVQVVLDRSPERLETYFSLQTSKPLSPAQRVRALKLLEMQRHLQLMYTSCGWFFDDIAGIETVQIVHYAARSIQLARELGLPDLEPAFLERLELAPGNDPEHSNGRKVYEDLVKPNLVDLPKVGAHFALSSLFERYARHTRIYCYQIEVHEQRVCSAGRARLTVGYATVRSEVTLETLELVFGALHFGDHNLVGGVCAAGQQQADLTWKELSEPFNRADFPQVLRLIDARFDSSSYSLRSLFKDEQRKILGRILNHTLSRDEGVYRQLYEQHGALIRFLAELGNPLPPAFANAAQFILNTDLERELTSQEPDLDHIKELLELANRFKVRLDQEGMAYAVQRNLEILIEDFAAPPATLQQLQRFERLATVARSLPFEVNFWRAQNRFYDMMRGPYAHMVERARMKDPEAESWVDHFEALGRLLRVRISLLEAPRNLKEQLSKSGLPGSSGTEVAPSEVHVHDTARV